MKMCKLPLNKNPFSYSKLLKVISDGEVGFQAVSPGMERKRNRFRMAAIDS